MLVLYEAEQMGNIIVTLIKESNKIAELNQIFNFVGFYGLFELK